MTIHYINEKHDKGNSPVCGVSGWRIKTTTDINKYDCGGCEKAINKVPKSLTRLDKHNEKKYHKRRDINA